MRCGNLEIRPNADVLWTHYGFELLRTSGSTKTATSPPTGTDWSRD